MKRKRGKVEVFRGHDARGRYRVIAPNGEITGASEAYATVANARRAARTMAAKLGYEFVDRTRDAA